MQTVPAKTVVRRNKNTAWFGCEYNMNIYRGCCHGCLYCDSRSACYRVENFDTVCAKENALQTIRNELSRFMRTGVVATGAMSDPYNPFEKQQLLTRHSLELISAYGFGAAIATKSDLIVRDADILAEIAKENPVLCKITITTPNDFLAAKLEPRAPSSTQRFKALEELSKAGIFAGVLLMPVLPFLEDSPADILEIVEKAAACGARFVHPYFGVTMRPGQREYLLAGLEKAFPEEKIAAKYRRAFGAKYHCGSPKTKELWQVFTAACKKTGLLYEMRDIVAAYRQGYHTTQLSFL